MLKNLDSLPPLDRSLPEPRKYSPHPRLYVRCVSAFHLASILSFSLHRAVNVLSCPRPYVIFRERILVPVLFKFCRTTPCWLSAVTYNTQASLPIDIDKDAVFSRLEQRAVGW